MHNEKPPPEDCGSGSSSGEVGVLLLVVEPVMFISVYFYYRVKSCSVLQFVAPIVKHEDGFLHTKMSVLTRLYRKYSTNHVIQIPSTINLHACVDIYNLFYQYLH